MWVPSKPGGLRNRRSSERIKSPVPINSATESATCETSKARLGRDLAAMVRSVWSWSVSRRDANHTGKTLARSPVARPASAVTTRTRTSGAMLSVGCSPATGSADAIGFTASHATTGA
jgi:hypothetical protein